MKTVIIPVVIGALGMIKKGIEKHLNTYHTNILKYKKQHLKYCSYSKKNLIYVKKSHTCEEGGGTPQNFFLVFIDELVKQIIIEKTDEVDQ